MMAWMALRCGGTVVDRFDAPAELGKARAEAERRFGPGAEVLSFAAYKERQRDEDAIARNARMLVKHGHAS